LAAPTAAADAMTKGYADSTYATQSWVTSQNYATTTYVNSVAGNGVVGGGEIYGAYFGGGSTCGFSCTAWGSATCVDQGLCTVNPLYRKYDIGCPGGSDRRQTGYDPYYPSLGDFNYQLWYICVKN
ncbi:hypothetical protein HY640_01985, partial [Candidatus Woesearchaeota archaeon]|nr:hypothetical protein [Candidatus Woesearchaeota archaeon]